MFLQRFIFPIKDGRRITPSFIQYWNIIAFSFVYSNQKTYKFPLYGTIFQGFSNSCSFGYFSRSQRLWNFRRAVQPTSCR